MPRWVRLRPSGCGSSMEPSCQTTFSELNVWRLHLQCTSMRCTQMRWSSSWSAETHSRTRRTSVRSPSPMAAAKSAGMEGASRHSGVLRERGSVPLESPQQRPQPGLRRDAEAKKRACCINPGCCFRDKREWLPVMLSRETKLDKRVSGHLLRQPAVNPLMMHS